MEAPSEVLAWAAAQPPAFAAAWAACDLARVRLWLARAGGATQRELVGAVATILDEALADAPMDPATQVALMRTTAAARTLVAGGTSAAVHAATVEALAALEMVPSGLRAATTYLLDGAQPVELLSVPHDHMWMTDLHASLLVISVETGTSDAPANPDARLRALLTPPGTPAARPALPLDVLGLTDAQLVGRVFVRALEPGHEATPLERVIRVTIDLEDEVRGRGLGAYVHEHPTPEAATAERAYRALGRADLAALVAEARQRGPVPGDAPAWRALDDRFAEALATDPTTARAAYVRAHLPTR